MAFKDDNQITKVLNEYFKQSPYKIAAKDLMHLFVKNGKENRIFLQSFFQEILTLSCFLVIIKHFIKKHLGNIYAEVLVLYYIKSVCWIILLITFGRSMP